MEKENVLKEKLTNAIEELRLKAIGSNDQYIERCGYIRALEDMLDILNKV